MFYFHLAISLWNSPWTRGHYGGVRSRSKVHFRSNFKKLTQGHLRSFQGHSNNSLTLDPMWTRFGPWLFMMQFWSRWGQGLVSYGHDLEWHLPWITSGRLFEHFWDLTFDLEWPQLDPLRTLAGVGTLRGVSLVEIGAQVPELCANRQTHRQIQIPVLLYRCVFPKFGQKCQFFSMHLHRCPQYRTN